MEAHISSMKVVGMIIAGQMVCFTIQNELRVLDPVCHPPHCTADVWSISTIVCESTGHKMVEGVHTH